MQNYIQAGESITVTAPRDGNSGDVVQVEDLIGVAADDFTSGESVVIKLGGVFEIPKNTGAAMSVGKPLGWNDTSSQAEVMATAYTYLGVAVELASAAATHVKALLGYVQK